METTSSSQKSHTGPKPIDVVSDEKIVTFSSRSCILANAMTQWDDAGL